MTWVKKYATHFYIFRYVCKAYKNMHKNNNHERHDSGEQRKKQVQERLQIGLSTLSLMSHFFMLGGGDVAVQHTLLTSLCLNNSYFQKL